jgi:hypothetical protein
MAGEKTVETTTSQGASEANFSTLEVQVSLVGTNCGLHDWVLNIEGIFSPKTSFFIREKGNQRAFDLKFLFVFEPRSFQEASVMRFPFSCSLDWVGDLIHRIPQSNRLVDEC